MYAFLKLILHAYTNCNQKLKRRTRQIIIVLRKLHLDHLESIKRRSMMMFMLVAVLIVLFILRHFLRRVSQLPPGPYTWQVLANLSSFVNEPHVAFAKLAKLHGPLVSFRVGTQVVVVASSPSTAKEILKNQLFTGRFFPTVFYNIPGSSHASILLSPECDNIWKFLREIGKHSMFSPKAVESNVFIRSTKLMEMMENLRANQGRVMNVDDIVFETFLNSISNVLASKNLIGFDVTGRVDRKIICFIDKVFDEISRIGLSDICPVLKHVDFWSKRRAMVIINHVRLIWGEIIKDKRRQLEQKGPNSSSGEDFLEVLLLKNTFTDDQIGVLLMELLLASSESTTGVTLWLIIEFVKNEDMLHHVRNEIAAHAIEGNSLNESRLSECQYFNACIKEALRIHNPGPFGVPRRATQTCKLGNYIIPKNSVVVVNFWAIHFDRSFWDDPASFRPERFLANTKANVRGTQFEYLPFSSGQRMCPGLNFAMKNIQVMVASLVYFFDWSPDGVPLSQLGAKVKYGSLMFKREEQLYLVPKERHCQV